MTYGHRLAWGSVYGVCLLSTHYLHGLILPAAPHRTICSDGYTRMRAWSFFTLWTHGTPFSAAVLPPPSQQSFPMSLQEGEGLGSGI